ncbi:hypothetical protein CRM22_003453 [Opisthorchis felineus]|uniref:Ig-like domain-containing protein n=1 Tax=Opisthorchis felineus TaxID=147828 RepID=A0A4S2M146_OPIFE|nr:hypothetical protein CRM22_003453 [Opisthorchis felineus]
MLRWKYFLVILTILILCSLTFGINDPQPQLTSQQLKASTHSFYRQQQQPPDARATYGPRVSLPREGIIQQPSYGTEQILQPGYQYGDPALMPPDHRANYLPTGPGISNVAAAPERMYPVQPGPIQENVDEVTEPAKNSSKYSIRDEIFNMITSAKNYERPQEGGNATVVEVNMRVLAIFSIDVRTMDYYVDALLRQSWSARSLAWAEKPKYKNFTENIVSPRLKEHLWLPDLFFRNGKDGYLHKLTLPNYLIRVSPTGDVLYSQKITMRFSCQMHLQNFPMDKQRCDMNIGSYGYTVSELKFVWRAENPLELASNLQLSEFETPKTFDLEDCSANYSTSTGQYACLLATFLLERQLGSYLATTYVPNILIIMVSWLSFWVNVDSAPARVPLGLLSLLGILTQAISVSSTLPRVSYIKAIDIWMIFSIIFVIGVLVEYAVALTVLRRKQGETWHEDVRMIVHEELTRWCAVCQQQQLSQLQNSQGLSRGQLEFCEEMEQLLTSQLIDDNKEKSKPRRPPGLVESEIDRYSRFLFPACYLLYNCFYWLYYLVLVNR